MTLPKFPRLCRVVHALLLLAVACVTCAQIAMIADLREFEWASLFELLGMRGIAVASVIDIGLVILALGAFARVRSREPSRSVLTRMGVIAFVATTLWVAEHVFMETPLTTRIAARFTAAGDVALPAEAQADLATFSLSRSLAGSDAGERLATMYQRIYINNRPAYARNAPAATIDRYAKKYSIDPSLLFFLAYVDRFYGEAVSGPVPFVATMTAETIRDAVQIHLPAWFVESPLRRALVSSSTAPELLGEGLGFKLRYAIHKATLDVSSAPYALNVFSDVFLILRTYPEQFADVFDANGRDPLMVALRDTLPQLTDVLMRPPCERPYDSTSLTADQYAATREASKTFARAAFYLTVSNFDFATRVQALLSRYQSDYYQERLGASTWQRLPDWQRVSMLAMIRDLYIPNVGHLSYNLYALPELNCTPLEFVAAEAALNRAILAEEKVWRPAKAEYLWAGAAYRLRVLNEVWSISHQQPIPGLGLERTTDLARKVIKLTSYH